MEPGEVEPARVVLQRGWFHLVPFAVLLGFLIAGYSPDWCAVMSIVSILVINWVRIVLAWLQPNRFAKPEHVLGLRGIRDTLVEIVVAAKAVRPETVMADAVGDAVVDTRERQVLTRRAGSRADGRGLEANAVAVPKHDADRAFDAATCIGCGACVAACKNASAMLFVSAKVSQLAMLPQGKVERKTRVENMIAQMDVEGFGACSNTGACAAECPVGISLDNIAMLNREYLGAKASSENVA
jgi:ferredoxin